ncbi:MAG: hypothetical protein VXZ72_05485 [Chlamydiota bacterium]|nr:hypothetical protein [Chlamydiota bacterium]
MANKQLQLRRGTKTQTGNFTGAEGEITYITDTKTAVVHDGSTQGGVELLRSDMSNLGTNDLSVNGTVSFADSAGNATVRLTNVKNPSSAQDVATKAYVDAGGTDITLDELGGVAIGGAGETTLGDAQVLIYDNADNEFRNKALSQDITITHEGVVTIANGVVTSAKIADATIVEGDIADDAVTSAKIADATIVAGNIANDTITATQIADNAITASELADDAVDTAAIADAAVTNAKIADTTIANAKLANSSITLATTGSGADDAVSLGETLNINGTANEVDITLSDNTVTIGLPDNVTIGGNLTVNGTTTTVNSTVVSVADPVFELGDDSSDDNLDRGIKLKYNNSGAKVAFMGLDDSDQKFVLIADATESSQTFSGTQATLKADLDGTVNTATQPSITTAASLSTVGTITTGVWNGTPVALDYIATNAINSSKIVDGSIVAGDLASNSVTTAKITDLNVTTAKLAADAVTAAKLADDAVVTDNIVAGNVTTAKLADDAVTAAKLADDAVVTANITNGNVTTAKLADDAVTAAKLAASAVVTDSIVDSSVTSAKIATSTIATSNIADTAVSTAKIADNAVTLAKMAGLARGSIILGDESGDPSALAVGAVNNVLVSDGSDLSYSSVTSAMIAAGAIVNDDINASAGIAHSKLANVTSGQILVGNGSNVPTAVAISGDVSLNNAGQVTIADSAVETAMLADDAVTLAKMQDVAANSLLVRDANTGGDLTEKALADKQILIGDGDGFTAAVLSGDVTMANDGAVTIANSAVDTIMIADNAVTLTKLADITRGSIIRGSSSGTPEYLAKGNANTVLSSDGTDVSYTQVATAMIADDAVTADKIAGNTIVAGNIATDAVTTAKIATDAVTATELATNAVETGSILNDAVTPVKVNFIHDALTFASSGAGELLLNDGSNGFSNVAVSGDIAITAAGAVTIQDDAVETIMIADDAVTAAKLASSAVVTGSIVDANVTTAKLADDAVTAAKLASSAVVTASIVDDAVTSAKIADNTIVEGNIANDAVTADKLASNAVVTASIVDANVTTAKINDLAVSTAKLANDAVTQAKLADSAVVTANIVDANVTTAKLAADAVTAAKLADDAVVTANIVDSNVTTAKLADNAVTTAKITDSNVTTAKIADSNVTLAKLANIASDTILGNQSISAGTPAEITCTSFGRELLADADASEGRATLGVVIGTNVQAYDADLDELSAMQTGAAAALKVLTAAEIAVLDAVTPGTGAASKALVLNSDSKITAGLSSLTAGTLSDGTATLTDGVFSGLDKVTINNLELDGNTLKSNSGDLLLDAASDSVRISAGDSLFLSAAVGSGGGITMEGSLSVEGTTTLQAKLETQQGVKRSVVAKASNYPVASTDHILLGNAAMTFTLPAPNDMLQQEIVIKNITASSTVTVTCSGQDIDGSSDDLTLTSQQKVTLISAGNSIGWISI